MLWNAAKILRLKFIACEEYIWGKSLKINNLRFYINKGKKGRRK